MFHKRLNINKNLPEPERIVDNNYLRPMEMSDRLIAECYIVCSICETEIR